uniref:Reverse transcriptase domain-containing protein n=1 Tax=Tanacetum cinerariifolium TaxID=118510 RepID=A0A699KCQ3_TANCI|nr:hypothetical protein [Tanacetum cinerariifolium]
MEEQKETQEVKVDNERQVVEETNETMVVTTSYDIPIITRYVVPYEPPIPFLGRLTRHAKEALVSTTIENIREIRVNLPIIKFTNQLLPKEKDPGSFIIPCSIKNVTVRNALADLGASEKIDYRWSLLDQGEPWDIGSEEEANRNRRCDIDTLSMVKPNVHWCKEILQRKGDKHGFWASCDPYDDECDGGDVPDIKENVNGNIMIFNLYSPVCFVDDKQVTGNT